LPVGSAVEEIQSGFACGRHNKDGKGIIHLRPMNVHGDGFIDLSDVRWVEVENGHRLRPGDVLFNNTNSPVWVGKTALVVEDKEFAFSNHMTRVRSGQALIPQFLAKQLNYLCVSGYFKLQCKKHVNQASISSKFLSESVPLRVAPLNEQKRIVRKIEALQTRSKKAKDALDQIPPLLEKFRQSVLAAAFRGDLTKEWREKNKDKIEPASVLLERIRVERRKKWEEEELKKFKAKGKVPKDDSWKSKYKEPEPVDTTGLPELPEGWVWARVQELSFVGTGLTPLRSEPRFWDKGTIPWIKSAATNQPEVSKAEEFVTDVALKETNLTIYPPGTLLVAMYGEGQTRGRCTELKIPATINQAMAALTFEGLTCQCRGWVKRYFQKNYEQIRFLSGGGVQPNLNVGKVNRLVLPLPPLAEQKVLIEMFEERELAARSIRELVREGIDSFSVFNQSILAKAFRGELVPQDPNDEPASVLLERIKAEREKNGATTKGEKRKMRRGGK